MAADDDALLAGVAELVDALDLGSSDESCGGSSPSARTTERQVGWTAGQLARLPNRFGFGRVLSTIIQAFLLTGALNRRLMSCK
jgi:hypothetical protein